MINLDDPVAVEALDKAGMLAEMAGFAEQCEQAVDIAKLADLDVNSSGIANIMVLGMGGSGISGDVCRVLFDDALPVPIQVNRYYDLPAYVGPETLVIAVSYSGNTEETVSALTEALRRGAKAVCVSSGGKISQMAVEKRLPLVAIPAGLQPRAALGYLSLPPIIILARLGLVSDPTDAIEEAVNLISELSTRFSFQAPESSNPAKQLARRLFGKFPVIYGSEGVTGLAAFRFKCQINENSKSPASWNLLPELDHNEITGWQCLEDISSRFHLIFLRDADEHPQVKKRVEVTRDLIVDQFCGTEEFWSTGTSKLARLFSLVYLGDFTSAYLALLNGIDPSPVERIELLKKRLV